LGGGCDGGILALEIARQLQAAGESVGLLVIWETPRTGFFERDWLGSALNVAGKLIQAPFRGDLKRLARRLRSVVIRHEKDMSAASPEEAHHLYICNSFWTAIRSYSNKELFRGRIVFIRARQQHLMCKDVLFGWDKMATAGVEIHTVPGDHDSYAKEYEADFASALGDILKGAHETASRALKVSATAPR
jgi:thioesterase domain-containing protein